MTVSAQFIVNELICGLCARPFRRYVKLGNRLCSITGTIGMGERVDSGDVRVAVRMSLLVLMDRVLGTVMNGRVEQTYLGLANKTFRVYVLDEEGP